MAIEFNTEFYLQSKFNQLEEAGRLEEFGLTDVASLAAFFEENGVDAQEHYLNAGMAEGINPSAEFDTTAYLEAKLAELKDTAKYGDTYAEYTVEDVIAAFKTANLTPLQHFNTYGESEGLTAEPAEEAGETSALTEALSELQTANTGVSNAAEELNAFLTDNEDYDLTEVEASADGVTDALEQADAELETATDARDDFVETTVEEASSLTIENDISGGAASDLEASLKKFVGSTQPVNNANLQAALTAAEEAIDNSEVLYAKAEIGDAGAELADATAIYQQGEGKAALFITEDYDAAASGAELGDAQSVLTFEEDALNTVADGDTLTLTVDGSEETYIYDTSSTDGWYETDTDGDATSDAADFITYDAASDEITIDGQVVTSAEFDPVSGDAVEAETIDTREGVAIGDGDNDDFATVEDFVATLTQVGWNEGTPAETADIDGVFDSDGELSFSDAEAYTLDEVATAAELQSSMDEAVSDLASARNANADNELLADVQASINAYIGAGGANDLSLLTVRNDIRGTLEADGFDADEFELNDYSGQTIPTSEALLNAITGETSVDGEVAIEAEEAPTTGEGTWVQGAETEVEGTFEFTYQPSAEEQTLLSALESIEDRETLISDAANAEAAFNGTVEGFDANVIQDAINTLVTLEQNVVDAEQLVTDVTELTDGLTTALEELDTAEAWFTDQDLALPVSLDEDRAGTEDGDIFLFSESEGDAFTISGFGEEGQDNLFFGGNYSLVSLAEQGEAGLEITDRVGDNDTLEIFWNQDGDNLQLFVEAEAAAGFDRGELATDQMTQITLEDFTAADITGFDGQILTAGVAAEQNVEVA